MEANMGRKETTGAQAEPRLPEGGPRVRLAAPAEQPTAHLESYQPVTLIGSRRDCDLFINHNDVSRIHCALVNTGRALIATDLCSRTGTFLNGQPISVAVLRPGDEFRVGSVPVEVQIPAAPDSSAAVDTNDSHTTLPAPLRLTGPQHQRELTTLPAVIGRRRACQVVLNAPDVSPAHALLFTIEGQPAIFDLGSRSGTFLNSERVTLAWLNDGDRLCIGGEELSLDWEGSHPAEHPASSTEAANAAAPTGTDAAIPGQLDDLEDLACLVEGLKAQISTSQAQLRERAAALDQRETRLVVRTTALEDERARLTVEKQRLEREADELHAAKSGLAEEREGSDARRADFERQRTEFETQRAEFEGERTELEAQRADFEHERTKLETQSAESERERTQFETQRAEVERERTEFETQRTELQRERTELHSQRGEFEHERTQLEAQQADLERQRTEFQNQQAESEHQRAQLDSERAALEQRLAEHETAANQLQAREAALDERQATLSAAELELASKETELAQREAANADAARRIARFKDALNEARRVLGSVDRRSEQSALGSGNDKGASAGYDPAANGDLPAPLVDQPLFTSPDSTAHQ